jgi:hypothetical protein
MSLILASSASRFVAQSLAKNFAVDLPKEIEGIASFE